MKTYKMGKLKDAKRALNRLIKAQAIIEHHLMLSSFNTEPARIEETLCKEFEQYEKFLNDVSDLIYKIQLESSKPVNLEDLQC